MNETEKLLIEHACARLVARYSHHADFGEAERVADLFAEDAVWEMDEMRFEGRDTIRAMMRGRQEMQGRRSRHVCTNLLVEVTDADHAIGLVYLTLYRHDFDGPETEQGAVPETRPLAVGQYRDRFVRTSQGWRFAHRKAEVGFGQL